MLSLLQVENFKAWKDTGVIRLAPLTVFFGTNSSGKTSIHQSLLLLKQTAQSPDRQRVLHFGDQQSPVELGNFEDVVYGHGESTSLRFRLAWVQPDPLVVIDPLHEGFNARAQTASFETEIHQEGQHLRVRAMTYALGNDDGTPLTVGMGPHPKDKRRYELVTDGYQAVRQPGRAWPLPAPVRFYGFPDEAIAYFQNTAFLSDLTLALERRLGSIYYVGPLREYPHRIYPWSGERPEHVGEKGERAVEALLSAKERRLNFGFKTKKEPFQTLVARWLKQMRLIESFEARPLGKNRKEHEVVVKTRAKSPDVKITDVGFGVSQVLPVVVECFYVPPNSTIIFEQPEIHLHPRVQADLADLFVEALSSREDGNGRNIQLIVESHSEHFLRRLQRRVAEEVITPDQVAVYFAQGTPEGSTLSPLELDLFGNIKNWPPGFFGDEVADLAAMTEAQAKRRLQTG